MGALAKRLYGWSARTLERLLSEPEPAFAPKPRPMTGLFDTLTPEQQKAALAYRGPENHGDPSFRKAQAA